MSPQQPDSVDQALDRLAAAGRALWQAEVAQVGELLALADAWRVDEDAAVLGALRLEGVERLVAAGGDGTAVVGEFLALEVGPVLGVSPATAAGRIADALNLRDRHPQLWAAVQQGALRVWQARKVTAACRHLPQAAAGWVDARLAELAGLLPWPRLLKYVEGLVMEAEPALAAERARRASETRQVRLTGISDGHVDVWGRLDAADALVLDEALDHIAGTLLLQQDAQQQAHGAGPRPGADASGPPALTRETGRATALGVLARGYFGEAALPLVRNDADADSGPAARGVAATSQRRGNRPPARKATLVVQVSDQTLAGHGNGMVRVDRWGPDLADRLGRLLAGCTVKVQPVLIPGELAPVDAYQVPARMRFAVEQRNPVEVFPYGTRAATACDLDHTTPYDPQAPPGAGQTHPDKLGPLSRRPHRGKTHGGWQVEQPKPGTYDWTSPTGRRYRVTPHGTRTLPRQDGSPRAAADLIRRLLTRPPRTGPPIDLCYPTTPLHVDLDDAA